METYISVPRNAGGWLHSYNIKANIIERQINSLNEDDKAVLLSCLVNIKLYRKYKDYDLCEKELKQLSDFLSKKQIVQCQHNLFNSVDEEIFFVAKNRSHLFQRELPSQLIILIINFLDSSNDISIFKFLNHLSESAINFLLQHEIDIYSNSKYQIAIETIEDELTKDVVLPLVDNSSRNTAHIFDLCNINGLRENPDYKFCINHDESIKISYDGDPISHDILSTSHDKSVLGAGVIKFRDGQLASISNYSGHYKPLAINTYYSFQKIAKKLKFDTNDYIIAVGVNASIPLNNMGGFFPVITIMHKQKEDFSLFYHNLDSIPIKTVFSIVRFKEHYNQYRKYISKPKFWKLSDNSLFTQTEGKYSIIPNSDLYIFLELLGYDEQHITQIAHNIKLDK